MFVVYPLSFLKILYNFFCKSLRGFATENQHSVFVLHNILLV